MSAPLLAAVAGTAPAGRSPWHDARKRFLRNRAAVAGMAILALIGRASCRERV